MNFVQKNPNDPKHEEFHDGHYEYWPIEGGLKPKSGSFPAAVLTGLELVAAAAAAGLLAAVLAVLYVISAPLSITENTATINANVYNNGDNQLISYTLSTVAFPDIILQEGTLIDNEDTLHLKDLSGGTEYLLNYYNSQQEHIGQFRFTTPGEHPGPDVPSDPDPSISPTDPQPETLPESIPVPETESPTEPENTTEPVTEPTVPNVRPPYVNPPAPQPDTDPEKDPDKPETEPPAEPPTEPPPVTPDEPTEPESEIIIADPDIGSVTYVLPDVSGDENDAYFLCEQIHTFRNVPADFTISVTQDGESIHDFSYEYSEDGTLTVRFTGGLLFVGKASTTTVTVTADGVSAASTYTLTPPSLESAEVAVAKNTDGTYTFTVTARIITDGTQEMVCSAHLFTTYADHSGVSLPMTQVASDRYTASYTTSISTEESEEEALAIVTGHWAMVGDDTYTQAQEAVYYYTP